MFRTIRRLRRGRRSKEQQTCLRTSGQVKSSRDQASLTTMGWSTTLESERKKCRDITSRHSRFQLVDDSGSAENAAKNVAPATVAVLVALVSISRVLLIALVIALHKALTKNLR